MAEVNVTRRVEASIEVVWTTITDIGRYPERVGSYVRIEFVTHERTGVGARWRQWRTVFGREHEQTLRIVSWDPPRQLMAEARESGAAYVTTYQLAQETDATVVSMTFAVRPTNPLAALFQRLLGRRFLESTRDAMERDLSDLATASEAAEQG